MSAGHVPVLGPEATDALLGAPGRRLVDATYGAGGYSRMMLETGAEVIGFDRDPTAIENATGHERLTLIEAPFDRMAEELSARALSPVHGVVFDFGVSSMQLDQAERGFSFMRDGPLDMRMGAGSPASAFVNEADEADIADVLFQYGEERKSRRLARAICQDRPFGTTGALARLAESVLGTREKIHPATRMFQAIRMLVNDELGQIVRGLIAAERVLAAGGRLAVVTFHSLEDRIAKRFLARAAGGAPARSRYEPAGEAVPATLAPVTRKAITPSAEEQSANPRARSAKLRVAERTEAAPMTWDDAALAGLGAPALTFSDLQRRWAA